MTSKPSFTAKRSYLIALALIASVSTSFVSSAQAETVPTTKCVTVATKKLRDAAQAQLEKDIAPYAGNVESKSVIAYYKEQLTVAWEAMEYPYCGMGSSGINPAIKSYNKTVVRARMKFLTDIKAKKVPAKAEVKTDVKKEEKKDIVATLKKTIAPGLRQGHRSESVKELQRRLVKHFGLTPEKDYVTGYFGPTTRKYLVKYQLEKKIIKSENEAGAGLVGPKTSAILNAK